MNPLVEKMLIAQREGIDVRTLEQIFEQNVKCECLHTAPGNEKCSDDVTDFFTMDCDPGGIKICSSCASTYWRWINAGDICDGCEKPLTKCWTIRPI